MSRSNPQDNAVLCCQRWVSLPVTIHILAIFVSSGSTSASEPSSTRFVEVAGESGLRFEHISPPTPERHLHLFMGSGVGWFDYDRDGCPDLVFCQGEDWQRDRPLQDVTNRIFRNRGGDAFADVTGPSGFSDDGYSMGVATGDFNNDGFRDLYITRLGPNLLYVNNGDGTFDEVCRTTGTNDAGYGASCTWGDADNDGFLDLFVVNYLEIDPANYPLCTDKVAGKTFGSGCHPRFQPGGADVFFHNEGDGTFIDASSASGLIGDQPMQGLGVVAADLDADRDLDFYVANDSVSNQLWRNDGTGQFVDDGLLSGVASNRVGLQEAGMGVAAGDVNGDGRCDLFVTNFFGETNTLYRNEGEMFTDITAEFGLAAPSRMRLGFGATLLDADNDGWLDLFVANGHIHTHLQETGRNEPFRQRSQMFQNVEGVRFTDASLTSGDEFLRESVARGSACADFDHDGRIDLAVQHLNGRATLLRNSSTTPNEWLDLELIGTKSNRDGIGAVVQVDAGARTLHFWRLGSNSYLSCDAEALHVGLGRHLVATRVAVTWPSGTNEAWFSLSSGHRHRLVEGQGHAVQ